jgi:hypothetical protein
MGGYFIFIDFGFFLSLTRLGLEQGYGTALGVITHLHEIGKLKRAFYTQSTPYHQGSRFVRSVPISSARLQAIC